MPNGSFTFCEVDVKDIGLNYAPEMSEAFVYKPAESQSQIETFDAHNGGYYYGSWTSPKTFTLRCFFEEKNIDKGIMSRVYSLFKVGRSGKLIFDRRPWCYYYATVTDIVQADYTNYLNGLVTIHLKAMYPFARSDVLTNTRTELNHETIMENTAVFDKAGMELPNEYDLNADEEVPIILINNGTERAPLGISISGDVGDGVIIKNKTTGQKCKVVAVTKNNTTNVNKNVIVDPISGKTLLTDGTTKELAFKYHEYGFLELEPSYPAVRNLYATYLGGKTVNVRDILRTDLSGKYIFINDGWYKIISQTDKHTLILQDDIPAAGSEKTMVIPVNEIIIKPITSMDIHLRFIFKPTYA